VVPRAQPATARDVSCTAPAGAGLGLQNPRRRVRFPGGVRPRRIDASSGLRVTLGRRVRPTISTQRPPARTSGSYPLRGGLDSLRCDFSGCPSVPPRPATGRTWMVTGLIGSTPITPTSSELRLAGVDQR
jgi:hypothetical protein